MKSYGAMEKFWTLLEGFFASPYLWGVVAIVAIAFTVSGKFSTTAANVFLWVGWGAAVFGIWRAEVVLKQDPTLRYLILVTSAGAVAIGAVLLGRWFVVPEKAPAAQLQSSEGTLKGTVPVEHSPSPPKTESNRSKPTESIPERSKSNGTETADAQKAFLFKLTQLYVSSHDGISPEMISGLELPPDNWLNEKLQQYGKNWRVKNGKIVKAPSETFSSNPSPTARPKPKAGEIQGTAQDRSLSPATSTTINNAPGGFAISGGQVVNPTVNNYGPAQKPARKIPPDRQKELIEFLRTRPGVISVQAIMNDSEAYEFAAEWYNALAAAGWTMKDKRPLSFVVVGKPWTGTMIRIHGNASQPNEEMTIQNSEPVSFLIRAFRALNYPLTGEQIPEQEEGSITLLIGPQ